MIKFDGLIERFGDDATLAVALDRSFLIATKSAADGNAVIGVSPTVYNHAGREEWHSASEAREKFPKAAFATVLEDVIKTTSSDQPACNL